MKTNNTNEVKRKMVKTIEQGVEAENTKTEDVRTLVKNSENHYTLTIINEGARLKTVKEFDKKQIKEIYSEVDQNIKNLQTMKQKSKVKAKMLTNLPESEQDKIEDFIHMLSQSKEYQEAEQAKESIPNIDKQIKLLESNLKELKAVCPEVLR